jgi:hypothetical protein
MSASMDEPWLRLTLTLVVCGLENQCYITHHTEAKRAET